LWESVTNSFTIRRADIEKTERPIGRSVFCRWILAIFRLLG
jgi:hypothetical protein